MKVFAVKNAIWLAEIVSLPIQIISKILSPISLLLLQFPLTLSKIIKTRAEKHLLSKDELKTLIDVGKEKGACVVMTQAPKYKSSPRGSKS